MPSREAFEVALAELGEYVEAIGHRVVEERREGVLTAESVGEERPLVGHRCESSGGSTYVVAGHPDLRFFVVGYVLSIRHNLADEMDERVAGAVLESRDLPESGGGDGADAPELRAVDVLLAEIPAEEVDAATSYFYLLLSTPAADVDLHFTDEGLFDFYYVHRQVHPYESDFGLQDFYEAVAAVETVGERGSRLVGRTVRLDSTADSPEEYSIDLRFDW